MTATLPTTTHQGSVSYETSLIQSLPFRDQPSDVGGSMHFGELDESPKLFKLHVQEYPGFPRAAAARCLIEGIEPSVEHGLIFVGLQHLSGFEPKFTGE